MSQSRDEHSNANWQYAVNKLAEKLNSIQHPENNEKQYEYAVIGSGAYALHGIDFNDPKLNPADIDITTNNLGDTLAALRALHQSGEVKVERSNKSTIAVAHYILTPKDGKPVDLEITNSEDFGFKNSQSVQLNGVKTTSLMDTLLSIYLRPEHRIKDLMAFRELVRGNIENIHTELSQQPVKNAGFVNAVNSLLTVLADPNKSTKQEIVDQAVLKILPRLKTNKTPVAEPAPPIVKITNRESYTRQPAGIIDRAQRRDAAKKRSETTRNRPDRSKRDLPNIEDSPPTPTKPRKL